MLNDTEKLVLIGSAKRNVLATGRLNESGWNAVVANNTSSDGSVNWTGVLTFVQGLITDLPEILAFIQALIPLFGA
jgi:hypothetical protein